MNILRIAVIKNSLIMIFLLLVGCVFIANASFASPPEKLDSKVSKHEKGKRKCTDHIDNDRDGLVDSMDPDCAKKQYNASCLIEGNLLLNPSADCGLEYWMPWNIAKVVSIDSNFVFSIEEDEALNTYENGSGSHIAQDVMLPLNSEGQYVVMAGYVMTEGKNNFTYGENLWAYFLDRNSYFAVYPIATAETMTHSCGQGCWQPRWGIFQIPQGIGYVRFFMDIQWLPGDDPAGVAGYFDDLELRVFPTYGEASVFVDTYIGQHPETVP